MPQLSVRQDRAPLTPREQAEADEDFDGWPDALLVDGQDVGAAHRARNRSYHAALLFAEAHPGSAPPGPPPLPLPL